MPKGLPWVSFNEAHGEVRLQVEPLSPASPGLSSGDELLTGNTDAGRGPQSLVEFWGVLDRAGDGRSRARSLSFDEDADEAGTCEAVSGTPLRELRNIPILTVSVGGSHVLFISSDWHVYAKGSNARGQLGVGSRRPHYPSCQWLPSLSAETRGGEEQVILFSPSGETQPESDPIEDEEALPRPSRWGGISAAACGTSHSLLLRRHSNVLLAAGAAESVGAAEDRHEFAVVPGLDEQVNAFATYGRLSCCSVWVQEHGSCKLYFWGEGALFLEQVREPFAALRIPGTVKRLALGASFGLALNDAGDVHAWGDGTHGELAGVPELLLSPTYWQSPLLNLPVPGVIDLSQLDGAAAIAGMGSITTAGSGLPSLRSLARIGSKSSLPRVVDLACGAHHALLLDDTGYVYSFGDNIAGQCGCGEERDSFQSGCVRVPRPVRIPPVVKGDTAKASKASKIFAGERHSALITADHRLFLWGHPANKKLCHAGYNPDGTEAGEAPRTERPPGVAARSALRDAVRKPREVFLVSNHPMQALGLGAECTFIVLNLRLEETQPNDGGDEAADGAASPGIAAVRTAGSQNYVASKEAPGAKLERDLEASQLSYI